MRIALLCETFPPKMGYLVSMLPKYLARLGADVHVLAVDLAPYHRAPEMSSRPIEFFREQVLSAGPVMQLDGYTVHILPHSRRLGHVFLRSLSSTSPAPAPQAVYCIRALGWIPLQ